MMTLASMVWIPKINNLLKEHLKIRAKKKVIKFMKISFNLDIHRAFNLIIMGSANRELL